MIREWMKWLRSEIQKLWSLDKWNKMYSKTEAHESNPDTDAEVEEWNKLYDTVKHGDDPAVVEWNELYNSRGE